MIIVKTTCPCCSKVTEHYVTHESYIALKSGKMIQQCFPEMDPSEREQFVSGICPECWDKEFPDE